MKYASNNDVMSFKRPVESKFSSLLNFTPDVSLDSVCDIEFVSNYQAIQVGIKNTFGYVRSRHESTGNNMAAIGSNKQPPISRPIGPPASSTSTSSIGAPSCIASGLNNNNNLDSSSSLGLSQLIKFEPIKQRD